MDLIKIDNKRIQLHMHRYMGRVLVDDVQGVSQDRQEYNCLIEHAHTLYDTGTFTGVELVRALNYCERFYNSKLHNNEEIFNEIMVIN